MHFSDFVVILVILIIFALGIRKMIEEKKNKKCIGCSDSANCGGTCNQLQNFKKAYAEHQKQK